MPAHESLECIKSQYYAIASQLQAPARCLRFSTSPQHDGSAHIEVNDDSFYYVVTERGNELQRKRARDSDELLYWLVSDLIRKMAINYELHHRVPNRDNRRLWFQKELELFAQINCKWMEQRQKEFDRILVQHPYRDDLE